METQDLIVNRAHLREAEIVTAQQPDLVQGEALLRIDSFALTANNITYAVAPEVIGYWNFFPVERSGWGRIPVWGFAEVIASEYAGLDLGTRLYGYMPMSRTLVIKPDKMTPHGLLDSAAHRQDMAVIYNQYSKTEADPAWSAEREGMISLFRPLFTTSFLLDDVHRAAETFGAETLILSSASSKTALGLAYLMARTRPKGLKIIGLTSPRNVEFCAALGVYDDILPYDEINQLPRVATAFVDMAGNADVLRAIHGHLGDALKNSCRVGLTHWQNTANFVEGLSGGPKPYFFFAPTYAQQRIADWGRAGFQSRLAEAWGAFISDASAWLQLRHRAGAEAVKAQYLQMLIGQIDPAEGHVLSMWDRDVG